MKKVLMMAVAVAVAFAFSAAVKAADTTKTVEKDKAKVGDVKVETKTTTVENKAADTTNKTIKVEEKVKGGAFAEETVTFKKFDANGDYIYVVKGKEEMKLKHKLSDSDKAIMMKKKEGDTITITSTYPLTKDQVVNNVVMKVK